MSHSFLQSKPEDLARALSDQNRSMQEKEAQNQALILQLPYVNMQNFPLDLNVLSYFTEEEAKQAESLPFFRELKDLRIGTVNPNNPLLKEKIKELSTRFKVTLYFFSPTSYAETLKYYVKVMRPKSGFDNVVHVAEDVAPEQALIALKSAVENAQVPAGELLTTICSAAMSMKASDIHLEPEEHILKIRFRVDGVLQDMGHLPTTAIAPLTSRIKILSKLKLNVTNVPQDGRFTFYRGAAPVDVRVSTLPSGYGESIVMRLLGVGAVNLRLNELGLRGRAHEIIEQQLNKPNGMIITTGPTGSGKTTTLYAFLNELNEPGVKIITLEDPIEYKLPGIQQTPIDYHIDFSFAKGLRAILRQDPDIIMVGEIRDKETAETALQAALTGHVVLSTLHTNDAAGAVPRLVTMGVQPFVIAPAVNAIIAQRLVRRLCEACRQELPLDKVAPAMLQHAKDLIKNIPVEAKLEVPAEFKLFHSAGCEKCHGLGYKGRIGIYEVVDLNDAMKALVVASANSLQLRDQAAKDGTISMAQDGVLKALEGITDLEEVFRVAGE